MLQNQMTIRVFAAAPSSEPRSPSRHCLEPQVPAVPALEKIPYVMYFLYLFAVAAREPNRSNTDTVGRFDDSMQRLRQAGDRSIDGWVD